VIRVGLRDKEDETVEENGSHAQNQEVGSQDGSGVARGRVRHLPQAGHLDMIRL